jgi:hypothetical protein
LAIEHLKWQSTPQKKKRFSIYLMATMSYWKTLKTVENLAQKNFTGKTLGKQNCLNMAKLFFFFFLSYDFFFKKKCDTKFLRICKRIFFFLKKLKKKF